jgi:hypothetical protein
MHLLLTAAFAGWSAHTETSAMDDTSTTMAMSIDDLTGPVPAEGLLAVTCGQSLSPILGFWQSPSRAWVDHDLRGETTVRLRVDDHEPVRAVVLNSDLNTALFRIDGVTLKQMADGSKLLLEVPIVNDGRKVYTLDLSGARSAFEGAGCPVSPVPTNE